MRSHRSNRRQIFAPVAALAVSSFLLVGCGTEDEGASGQDGGSGQGGGSAPSGDALSVKASFYPLQFVAERVGGDLVAVDNITPAGADAHDIELTAQDVAAVEDADLVFYLSDFAPSVDDAIDSTGATAFDVADADVMDRVYTEEPVDSHDDHGDDEHGDDEHGDDEHGDDDHDHGGEAGETDPHFWLDPVRLATVADAFADQLAELDPDNADVYRSNAEALGGELDDLDGEFEAALADCQNSQLVTSHTSFGYLADRYGMEQVGIAGLSPSEAPSPSEQAELADFVADNEVRTIYYETTVSPDIAETIANEAGAQTAVLDPLEGLTDDSEGSDYLEVMRSNLANLQEGQPCP
ncbi:zinc ABC transporter substrate-binding protein [soil metagenome]